MKAFLVPLLYSALLSGASLAFGETAAGTASPSAAAPAEKIPSAESLINQAFSFAINIQQTLAGVQDKESADNAVKTLQDIQKDIRHFLQLQDKLNDAEKEKEDALIEKMEKRMEMLDNRCRQEGKRLFEARYYGSAASKDILENSDEFSDLVEPDENGAPPMHSGKMKRPDSSPPAPFLPPLFHSRHALSPYGFLRGQVHFKLAGTVKNGFTVGSMQKLAGKTAIVTGAGRGIGNAVARRFASEGARVILISRSPSSCGGAAEEINKEFPDSCKAYPCDVADYAAVQETMAAILKDFPQIDILVNNAGITRDSLMLRMKEEDWDAVLDTNLKSAFNTVKALQRVLMKSPAGRIINMSSVIGLVGNIGQANYAASKAGLIGFTKSLAQEFAPRKVTCNAIAPGFISTEMSNAIPDNLKEEIVKKIPLKEQGSVEDIAALTAFLASDDARYITGQVIACDGGMTM